MLFDTHAHLNDAQFDPDRAEVIRRAEEDGVGRIVEIADSPAQWGAAVALSRAWPRLIRCSLGLHPYHAADWSARLEEALPRMAKLPEVAAVGEIGLDYVKSQAPPDVQKNAFAKMLALAWRCELPVVIHCRGAYHDLMPMLERFYADKPVDKPLDKPSSKNVAVVPEGKRKGAGIKRRFRGVLHCFSSNAQDAAAAVALGFALGVDGPITYPKNEGLREALKAAGLDNLVLETDSPYLPPQSSRGKRNEPRSLKEIADKIAGLFGVSADEAARSTFRNGQALFHLAP